MDREIRINPVTPQPVLEKDWQVVFPANFDFYGLGKVQRTSKRPARLEHFAMVLSFELLGEESGSCIVGFEEEPIDGFMAMEIASILCAKISARLAELTTISTPQVVEEHQTAFTGFLNESPVLYGYQLLSDEMPYLNFRVAVVLKKTARA